MRRERQMKRIINIILITLTAAGIHRATATDNKTPEEIYEEAYFTEIGDGQPSEAAKIYHNLINRYSGQPEYEEVLKKCEKRLSYMTPTSGWVIDADKDMFVLWNGKMISPNSKLLEQVFSDKEELELARSIKFSTSIDLAGICSQLAAESFAPETAGEKLSKITLIQSTRNAQCSEKLMKLLQGENGTHLVAAEGALPVKQPGHNFVYLTGSKVDIEAYKNRKAQPLPDWARSLHSDAGQKSFLSGHIRFSEFLRKEIFNQVKMSIAADMPEDDPETKAAISFFTNLLLPIRNMEAIHFFVYETEAKEDLLEVTIQFTDENSALSGLSTFRLLEAIIIAASKADEGIPDIQDLIQSRTNGAQLLLQIGPSGILTDLLKIMEK